MRNAFAVVLGVALLASPSWGEEFKIEKVIVAPKDGWAVVEVNGTVFGMTNADSVDYSRIPRFFHAQSSNQAGQMTTIIAHLAIGRQPGGRWFTLLDFVNRNVGRGLAMYEFFATDGSRLKVRGISPNGVALEGQIAWVDLSSKSAASEIVTTCQNDEYGRCNSDQLKTGWVKITTNSVLSTRSGHPEPEIEVGAIFQFRDDLGKLVSSAGVTHFQFDGVSTSFLLPAVSTPEAVIGLGIADPGSAAATVTLKLYNDLIVQTNDPFFVRQPFAVATLTLQPGHQISGLIGDFFRGNAQFEAYLRQWSKYESGNIEIFSTAPIAILGLRADRLCSSCPEWMISGIPAIFPGREQ